MKILSIIFSLFFVASTFASDSVWVHASGSGWGGSEYSACNDAERDAKWGMEDRCRWEAEGNLYSLSSIRYSRCYCSETGSSFRCRTDGDALCQIWD